MISVQFTIAGSTYENIKVRIEGASMVEVMDSINSVDVNAAFLFRAYETFIQVRDTGHREAVEAVVQGLGAVVVEEVSDEGHGLAEDPSKPFWDKVQADTPDYTKKPWERKQSSPGPAPSSAGQTVNLL